MAAFKVKLPVDMVCLTYGCPLQVIDEYSVFISYDWLLVTDEYSCVCISYDWLLVTDE